MSESTLYACLHALLQYYYFSFSEIISKYNYLFVLLLARVVLNRQGVLFNFRQNHIGADQILGNGRRRLFAVHFANNVLKASIVQEQLRQTVLENFHAVAKVGKITENFAIDLLNGRLPLRGKVDGQRFHDGQIDGAFGCICIAVVAFGRYQIGFGLLHKGNHLGKVRQQFLLDKLFAVHDELFEQGRVGGHAAFLENGHAVIEVVDQKDGALLLVVGIGFFRQALEELQVGVQQRLQVLEELVAGRGW